MHVPLSHRSVMKATFLPPWSPFRLPAPWIINSGRFIRYLLKNSTLELSTSYSQFSSWGWLTDTLIYLVLESSVYRGASLCSLRTRLEMNIQISDKNWRKNLYSLDLLFFQFRKFLHPFPLPLILPAASTLCRFSFPSHASIYLEF